MATIYKLTFLIKGAMAEIDFTELRALLAEIKKPERELLYNLAHKNYKNTSLKQIIWREIAEALSMEKSKLQTLWKTTRLKYKAALAKYNAPSGSARRALRPMEEFLVKEMDFLRPYVEDDEKRSTTYVGGNTADVQQLFDTMATDPDVVSCVEEGSSSTPVAVRKRRRIDLEMEVLSSLQRLEEIQAKRHQAPAATESFYAFFQQEMEKLPLEKREFLKKKFCKEIMEA